MIYKIQKIFEKITDGSKGMITDAHQLEQLLKRLFERKILVEHDITLILKYVKDYPFDFLQFCNYVRHIYKLDIEQLLSRRLNNLNEFFNRVTQFLNFYGYKDLTNDDLYQVLATLNISIEHLDVTLKSIKKNDFLFKNIHDDITKYLWEGIYKNSELQSIENNPDFFVIDPIEYQSLMNSRIEYEFDIIRTKKIHYNPNENLKSNKKKNKILIEKAYCADRDIPIQTLKIPVNFYDKETISKIVFKCEAYKQLLFSKYFPKFTGSDDISNDEYQFYYFEYIEGVGLTHLIKSRKLDITDNSLLFRYLAKEILLSLRDLLCKTTHTFNFPISLENFHYEIEKYRLYMLNMDFGPTRQKILESQNMIEAKLLYYYGLILINLLAISKPELEKLLGHITHICDNFSEFEKMQAIFDHIASIEEQLSIHIENEYVIAIIIECLLSPYKAKLVFDEFYEKKNFLKEIFEQKQISENKHKGVPKKLENTELSNQLITNDRFVATQPYYEKDYTNKVEESVKNIMTMNLLLVHPFYESAKFENEFINYLLKLS
jgi:hypothetical protein